MKIEKPYAPPGCPPSFGSCPDRRSTTPSSGASTVVPGLATTSTAGNPGSPAVSCVGMKSCGSWRDPLAGGCTPTTCGTRAGALVELSRERVEELDQACVTLLAVLAVCDEPLFDLEVRQVPHRERPINGLTDADNMPWPARARPRFIARTSLPTAPSLSTRSSLSSLVTSTSLVLAERCRRIAAWQDH